MKAGKIQKMRERLLLCSICMNEFSDPRILPCHHTFCLDCIDSITQNRASFNCPQCRVTVHIPIEGIRKLPVNFYIVSLRDELPSSDDDDDDDDGTCDLCEKENIISQFHCDDCDMNICRFCISSHWLEEHDTGTPNITPIQTSSSHSLSTTTHFCKEHIDEIVQLYCYTCQKDICITCSCTVHRRHKLVPLSKHLKKSKDDFYKELEKINVEWQHAVESLRSIKIEKEDVIDVSKKSLDSLNDVAETVCKKIMERKIEIEREIKTQRETQLKNIVETEKHLQAYMNMLKKGQDFLLDMQENEICLEAVDCFKRFLLKVREDRENFISRSISIKHILFTPSDSFKLVDLNYGNGSSLFAYGKLGNISSKQQSLHVDKKTLAVQTKRNFLLRFCSWSCFNTIIIMYILLLFLYHIIFGPSPLMNETNTFMLTGFFKPE